MKPQYRKNMRRKQLEVFKKPKTRTQAQMMEELIVINRENCICCTLIFFVFLFTILTLYSFKFTTVADIEMKIQSIESKLKKFEGNILNMSNVTETSLNKILPEVTKRIYRTKCIKINDGSKKNNYKKKLSEFGFNTGENKISKILEVHFISFSKLKISLDRTVKLKQLGYNLTTVKEGEEFFVKAEAPESFNFDNLEICALVSGIA